jgi:hypothetical protein
MQTAKARFVSAGMDSFSNKTPIESVVSYHTQREDSKAAQQLFVQAFFCRNG